MACVALLAACWILSRAIDIEFADICDEVGDRHVTRALCGAIAP